MPCFRPLEAFRRPGGGITFDQKESPSLTAIKLPCGQCYGCRLNKAREWALRCVHESQMHDQNCFITLTYNDECLPEDRSLDVRVWQLFAKRLRKRMGPFRFLHCGEYGDEDGRPHYHALLFGQDFSGDRELFKRGKRPVWISETLGDLWPFGFHYIQNMSFETASYVAQYTLKKVTGLKQEEYYKGKRPPYATMSRGGRGGKGGLGSEWFQKFQLDLYRYDECVSGGRVFRPPDFYDQKLSEAERMVLNEKRRNSLNLENMTDERLKSREKVAIARANFKARNVSCS